MKKISAVILALVMALSLTATAFADVLTGDEIPGDANKNVQGQYVAGSSVDTDVYQVKIEWGSMIFTFKGPEGGKREWNPETHKWDSTENPTTPAGWSINEADAKVTVTNHSSKGVNVSFELDKAANTPNAISATLKDSNNADLTSIATPLVTAVGTAVDKAPSVTGTVALEGDLPATYTTPTTLFTLTVSLAK